MIGLYMWVRVNELIHLPEILPSPMHILDLSFHQNMGKGMGKGKGKSENENSICRSERRS